MLISIRSGENSSHDPDFTPVMEIVKWHMEQELSISDLESDCKHEYLEM